MIKLLSRNRLLFCGVWAAVHNPKRLLGSSKVKSMVTSSHRTMMVVVRGLNILGKDEVSSKPSHGLEKAYQVCISFGTSLTTACSYLSASPHVLA
jgi:hypothetical protein